MGIAIYSGGVPLAYMALLFCAREAIKQRRLSELSHALMFLYDDFDRRKYFWELLSVSRLTHAEDSAAAQNLR